jgi:murein DD-endopeptidase MepM/ murein hydrolase activator NlpD
MALALVGLSAFPSAAQDTTTTTIGAGPTTTAPATSSSVETPSTSVAVETTVDTTAPAAPTTLNATDRKAKATAAGKLNAAVAADSEIAAGLRAINQVAQETQSRVGEAQRSLEEARATLAAATDELIASSAQQADVEAQLKSKAVEGFKTGLDDQTPSVFFGDHDMNQSIRQAQLLHQANKGTAELLEELRNLKEDQRVAQAEASQAQSDAESLQADLTEQLATLRQQQEVQLRLKREAESRIAKWETALSAYAAEDRQIQNLITTSSPTKVSVSQLRPPSAYGFQWPVVGPVTSEYGYRIHPVYGTRKLHSGLDISAPRGTPIAAATDGVVLAAGVRGGYGNCVIIDHGDGVSTLYGHMSQISVSEGRTVKRGDTVGLVGATGTATGNHLHFEVRINGEATNPRSYLPPGT